MYLKKINVPYNDILFEFNQPGEVLKMLENENSINIKS